MLTIAISVLFGIIALASLVQIHAAVTLGVRRAGLIAAELRAMPKARPLPQRRHSAPLRFAIA